ncbi:MAG: hypothetical protein LBK65_07140 [Tannerellaceae bacterium]|jgi:hypothetical protein|nr:hypothetical protein [Tannerellaceae bacterium]
MEKKKAGKTHNHPFRPETKKKPQSNSYLPWLVKNVCAAAVAGFLLFECVDVQGGYNWVYNMMLKGNMELIKANPDATIEQRNEFKLGTDYSYLLYVKNSTPEDAVILYPSHEDFFPPGVESPFKQNISNKIWALRFLYPRKLVLPSEMGTNRYTNDITHVAIVNGRGYERLNYETEAEIPTTEFTVISIKR